MILTLMTATTGATMANDYFLDSANGNDKNGGVTQAAPWQTLAKLSATTFQPGDRILLKAGGSWTGMLHPLGSGKAGAPITLGRYGDGAKPVIDGGGAEAAVLLEDQQHWVIEKLELRNTTTNRIITGYLSGKHKEEGKETQVPGIRSGIAVRATGTDRLAGLRIADCDIHSIQGSSWRLAVPGMYANAGIHVATEAPFDHVLIENNHVHDIGTIGMIVWVGTGKNAHNWLANDNALWGRKLIVRGNRIVKTGADGMIVGASEGALIEHNICYEAGANAEKAQDVSGHAGNDEMHIAGIWCIASKDALFQYNECARTRTFPHPADSEAYNVDMGCRGAITFQYNYSHDNSGGALMVMNWNPHLEQVIYRYNISQNDGRHNKLGRQLALVEQPGQMFKNADFNNNVFVNTVDDKGFGMGDCEGVTYRNNIFYWRLQGSQVGPQEHGPSAYPKRAVFEANCFAGHEPLVKDNQKLVADPKFVEPGKGGDGLETVAGYRLQPESPCLNAGVPIPDNGGRDFFGTPIPNQGPSAIGAHQPH
jgi:hypothetical protein